MLVASNYVKNEFQENHLKGAINDAKQMEKVLKSETFNYQVELLLDSDARECMILALIDQLSDYLKDYDGEVKEKALVFAFAGHGGSGDIIFTDEGCSFGSLSLEKVTTKLKDHPNLQQIPKLFFIDACQGKGEIMRNDILTPNYELGNFLVARSHRTHDTNSWMQRLAKRILNDYSKPLSVILDELTDEFLNSTEERDQQPQHVSRLWGSFIFCKGP